jgi:hypothetical protein
MTVSVKVLGAYKESDPYVKVGGSWYPVSEGYVKVAGNWEQTYTFATNYWGTGADGTLNTTGDVNLTSTLDGDMVVRNYSSLTINAGHTLTTTNRCKGLLIYVNGNCTINGKISMTARGANVDPLSAGVSASGIRFRRIKAGQVGSDSTSNLLAGCGTAAVAAENSQVATTSNGIIYTIQRSGAAGAVGGGGELGSVAGTAGSSGSTGQSGGGGRGGLQQNGAVGSGSAGTCFSGGAGSGGSGNGGSADAGINGGGGSAGSGNLGAHSGGAGNPGGAGVGAGSNAGSSGTGGLVILIVRGILTIGATGSVEANGLAGGNAVSDYYAQGGGGSGGGNALILYGQSLSNNGTVTANGGGGGTATANIEPYGVHAGGGGGDGSVQIQQVDI